jgi:hypothetical protein
VNNDPSSPTYGATSATLSADWSADPNAGSGTQYVVVTLPDTTQVNPTDADAASKGVYLVPGLHSGEEVVHLVNPNGPDVPLANGTYTLNLYSTQQFDENNQPYVKFGSVLHDPAPAISTFNLGAVPTDGSGLLPVALSGTVDEAFKNDTLVTLCADVNNDPQHRNGVPISPAMPITTDGKGNWHLATTWDLEDLEPYANYYLYAIINDGHNAPITSDYSVGVLPPSAPISGLITDLASGHNGAPVSSVLVYLTTGDSKDAPYDPTDMHKITDPQGYFSFWQQDGVTSGVAYWVHAIIPQGFQLAGGDGNTNPRQETWGGGNQGDSVPFGLIKLPSISGTVFHDSNNDGHLDPGDPGLGNWLVQLTDSNGVTTTAATGADGTYTFLGLAPGQYTLSLPVPPTTYYQTSPQPVLNPTVTISPTTDNPYPQITGQDFGVLKYSTVSGNVSQHVLHNGTLDPNTTPVPGQTVYLLGAPTLAIDAGGKGAGNILPDQDFSGGKSIQSLPSTDHINTSYLVNPPLADMEEVLHTYRQAVNGQPFSYTVPGLAPGAAYWVRLDFAETFWDDVGDRIFNVAINGQTVLDHFDVSAAAAAVSGGNTKAIAIGRSFLVTADASGKITILFTSVEENAEVNGIEITRNQPASSDSVAIDAGGKASGNYQADTGFTFGQPGSNSSTIDTSLVTNPAPPDVYKTYRHAPYFYYTVTGLEPNVAYLIRLTFVENFYTQTGQRLINLQIGDQIVQTDFDIFAAAGARNRAVAENFTATADRNGVIKIFFESANGPDALVNAIELTPMIATTTTDASGNYNFAGLRAGTYTVSQAATSGARQVVPFSPGLNLQTPANNTNPVTVNQLVGDNPQPNSLTVGDFDGDGQQDVAVLDPTDLSNGVQIFYGGIGNPITTLPVNPFLRSPLQITAGDFYGTGRQDLAVLGPGGAIQILRNEGRGAWDATSTMWFTGQPAYTIAYSMVSGRFLPGLGHDSLAVLYRFQPNNGIALFVLEILYIDGSGNLQQISSPLPVNDFDTPGTMLGSYVYPGSTEQVVIGWQNESPILGYVNSGGTLTLSPIFALGPGRLLVAGDINGDGRMDVGNFEGDVRFHYALQDQVGNWTPYTTDISWPGFPTSAFLVDVNGDLKPDLVWVANGLGNRALYVALNTGQTDSWLTASRVTNWSLGPGGRGNLSPSVADMNGDGLNDMVVTDQAGGFVEIVYNDSVTAPTPYIVTVTGTNSTGDNFVNAQLGQLNGRVFDDVTRAGTNLLSDPARAGVTVYVDLNGNGQFDPPHDPSMVTGPDGYYAFSDLPAGHYQVRYIDDETRAPTTAEDGVYNVDLSVSRQTALGLDFGDAVSLDPVLTVPASTGMGTGMGMGTTDWTIAVNQDRLEVSDSMMGVVDSEPLAEMHSLTIVDPTGGPVQLTLDLSAGFFNLPAGVTFVGGTTDKDTLHLILGPGDDDVTVNGQQATIDGLAVRWARVKSLTIDGGPGNNQVSGSGTPVPGGTINLIGGTGNDTYALATRNSSIQITDSGGLDTLDLSGASAGVNVNLGLDRGQVQHIGGGNNTLAIRGTIETLIGTRYNDVLTGNNANNVIRGLGGNDVLIAGRGNTVLVGGLGHDVLIAGRGRDVLIAGSGPAVLLGAGPSSGGSILIGGSTAYDTNDQALRRILAEWDSDRPLATRIRDLTDGSGRTDRLNGSSFLNDKTLHAGAADILFGDSRVDWFLPFPQDWVFDSHRRR